MGSLWNLEGRIVKALTALVEVTLLMSMAMCASAQSPNQTQRSSPIAVGEVSPDFTLEDQNGNKITLSATRGKSPVVLVFYRGYW
jgi:cytochrome oxidase Cu insertion factor (SCO1/SenC/PrrC family)